MCWINMNNVKAKKKERPFLLTAKKSQNVEVIPAVFKSKEKKYFERSFIEGIRFIRHLLYTL